MAEEERPEVPANALSEALDDALRHVIRILTAVSCCMMLVVVTVNVSPQVLDNQGATLPYTPLPDTNEQVSFTRATNAAANAFMLLGVIITMTVFMVTLYYYRFYSVIGAWITLSCALILVISPITYIGIISGTYNIPMDVFSVGFFVYNFMALGLVVILSKGPLIVQQFYLIVESSFMALILIKFLPAWTLWVVLCLIPIWDLVAVLAVIGPLRILVETAKERKEGLQPGLIFSTMVAGTFAGMASQESGSPEPVPGSRRPQRRPSDRRPSDAAEAPASLARRRSSEPEHMDHRASYSAPESHEQEELETLPQVPIEQLLAPPHAARLPPDQGAQAKAKKSLPARAEDDDSSSDSDSDTQESQGIKMGLGDFVFYSVLVGKVATFGDWAIVFAAFIGILVGVCVTLFLLAVMESALPALPLSLAFGLTFVGFQNVIQNFVNELFSMQAFI
ncbi:hypothetical protein V5799_019862 [Amblyomma americanum]|uniref:Presenilin n=1 Tax=Amblyomma americanum TaxID=6943 RepID=A0AAQ4EVI8_AMBAM